MVASRILGALVFLDSLIVLAGWLLDWPALASFNSGEPSTPVAAIGLIALGASTWALPSTAGPEARSRFDRRVLSTVLAALVLAIGAVTLAELTFARALDIDRLVLAAIRGASVERALMRTSGASALGLTLLGAALLFVNAAKAPRFAQALALGGLAISLCVMAGHLYEAAALARTPFLATVGLPTGVGLFLAGLAILVARPTVGVMRLFASVGLGGTIARRAIVPIVLAPVLANWLELSGERRGWYPEATGWSLDAVVTVAALALITWWGASVIQRKDDAQRTTAARLTESEERYRQLIETSPDAIIVKSGRQIAEVNRATLAMLGVSDRRELIGRSPFALVEPARRADVESRFCALLDQPGAAVAVEDRIRRTDGTLVDVAVSASSVQVAGSRLVQVLMRDITERKRQEQVLRESLERFELIARATHDATWEFDVRSGAAWWSDSYRQRFGISPEAPPSVEAWAAGIHPEDRARVLSDYAAALDGTVEEWSEEYRCRRADGSYATVHDRAFIVRDVPGGAAVRVVGSVQDVSAQRSLEVQVREAQKMEAFGQLAGGVAHDFNNTLTAISGFAELLLAGEPPDSARRVDLMEITEASRRAAALTRQLLLFSRREVMEVSRFDVNDAIRSITRMLTRTIGEAIHIELDLAPTPLWVDGDVGMFDQVMLNLAVNARDAMPRGGRVTIATTSVQVDALPRSHRARAMVGPYVCISVADTGEGIPPDILPRVFEPFFTTKPAGKGTGLGLATVFGIVEQHNGWVDVESRVGEGTTMRVWIPASRSAGAPRPTPRRMEAARGGGETILLVEDDTAVRALTRAVLTRNGYHVLAASDGPDALALWERNSGTIALLLTDIVMPSGMSGQELAARLQAAKPALQVVLTSGYSPDLAGIQIDAGEHAGFLHKPFTPEQLLAAVRRALGHAMAG